MLRTLTQRRQNQRHHVEPEKQILPEPALRHFLLEISIRRRDQTNVNGQRLRPADALKLALLQHAQQLHLHRRAQVANLVEKKRAAISELKTTFVTLRRVCKRALLVTKQLRLDQRLRQRRTTDRDERSSSTRTLLMNRTRKHLFARAILAAQQHCRARRRN